MQDFLGLPLPLFPDISKAEVTVGVIDKVLHVLGISKKKGTTVSLWKGPNGRANRYLNHEYMRMVSTWGGTLDPRLRTKKTRNFTSKTDFGYKYLGKDVILEKGQKAVPAKLWWTMCFRKLDLKCMTRSDRKAVLFRSRKFWAIGMQLLTKSTAFRLAELNKTLSKFG